MLGAFVERNEKFSEEKGRVTGPKKCPITRPEGD